MKKVVPFIILLSGLFFLAGCGNTNKNESNSNVQTPIAANGAETANTATPSYFDDSSPVMFFYSDSCGWCNKEKTELEALVQEGFRVKPMNVGTHEDYWQTYNISGTPTFIAAGGDKLTGYKTKDELKPWLEKNGAKIK